MAIASKGTMGTGAHSTSATSYTMTTATTALVAGEVCLLVSVTDNVQTTSGPSTLHSSVSATNLTWTKLAEYTNGQGGAAAGVTTSVWLGRATGSVPVGTVITMTLTDAVVDKCCSCWAFTVTADYTLGLTPEHDPIGYEVDGANGFGSAKYTGLINGPQRLFLAGLGKEANTTTALTPTSGWTAISGTRSRNVTAAVIVRGEFLISTATTATSNPTLAVSGDTASVLVGLREVVATPLQRQWNKSRACNVPDGFGTTERIL